MTDYSAVRAMLEKKLSELNSRVAAIDNDLSEPMNNDWEERATEIEDNDVLSTVGNISLDEIEQIKLAINQIDSGHYGVCASCGQTIAPERLEALPFVTTCIHCA